jgi:cytochrome c biogenesis protein CcdA
MRGLLRALLVVAAIGLADSLNPSTVGPAVYFAIGPSPVRRILAFTAGVFTTYMIGGVLLLLGPGQLLLSYLPHPRPHTRHLLAVPAGIALIVVGVAMWLARERLTRRGLPGTHGNAKSSFAAGVTLMVAELPTAFPLFGAVAVIIGSRGPLPAQIGMLVMFNLLFVAPLLIIAALVAFVPGARRAVLEPVAKWLGRHWPTVFAALAIALGAALAATGLIGLRHR